MIYILGLFASLAIPTLIGYQFFYLIARGERFGFFFSVALSYGLGLGVLSYTMLALGILDITYSVFSIALGMLVVSIILFFIQGCYRHLPHGKSIENNRKKGGGASPQANTMAWRLFRFGAFILIAYYGIYMFWCALNLPVYTWDSIATSVYNAKVLFFEKTLKAHRFFAHQAYPLQYPMILTWMTLNLGEWNDQLIKIIFPLTFMMFVLVFYAFLNQVTDPQKSLLGVVLLFSSNFIVFHATISYRDIFMMYYICTAIFLLIRWRSRKSLPSLILASLFAGIGSFMKLEGAAYLLIIAVVFAYILMRESGESFRGKCCAFLKFLAPAVGLWGIYYFYKMIMGYPPGEYVRLNIMNIFTRTMPALGAFAGVLFFTANWNIAWHLLIIVLAVNLYKIKTDMNLQILLLALACFLGLHFAVGVLSDQGGHVISPDTLSRLCIHFFPIVISLIVIPFDLGKNSQQRGPL